MSIRAWLIAHVAVCMFAVEANAETNVRQAIMGHEKFVVRCTDDLTVLHFIDFIKRTQAMSMSEASQYALQQNDWRRSTCDGYYEGINVCTEDGPQAALSGLEKDMEAVNVVWQTR